jgi:hypothetical protein
MILWKTLPKEPSRLTIADFIAVLMYPYQEKK